eukprot:gene24049-29185_t
MGSSLSDNASHLSANEANTCELFKRCAPAVVQVSCTTLRQGPFSLDLEELPKGTGSGFIWNKEGHIVTNFHVIRGAQRAQVTLHDGTILDASLTGTYPDADLAVLKVDSRQLLHTISVGSSCNLQVGQRCFAIGNPFGLDQTLSSGIVSGLGRDIKALTGRTIRGVVQTDAAINP